MADRKAQLSQATEKYKKAIENQVVDLRANAGKIGKNALVIGGVLLVSYAVVRLLVGKEKTKKIEEQEKRFLPVAAVKKESRIVSMIKQQIALFLLGIAKQRIAEFLEKKKPAK